jgi:hypothetical protein
VVPHATDATNAWAGSAAPATVRLCPCASSSTAICCRRWIVCHHNANLAAALVRLGHEVHLLCQTAPGGTLPFDAVADWDGGSLSALREPVRCTVYRPASRACCRSTSRIIRGHRGAALPGLQRSRVGRPSGQRARGARHRRAGGTGRRARYHLVMGPLVSPVRSAGTAAVPYAVKVHGSDIEYTVAPHPGRFVPRRARASRARAGPSSARAHRRPARDDARRQTLRVRIRLGPPASTSRASGPDRPRTRVSACGRSAGGWRGRPPLKGRQLADLDERRRSRATPARRRPRIGVAAERMTRSSRSSAS